VIQHAKNAVADHDDTGQDSRNPSQFADNILSQKGRVVKQLELGSGINASGGDNCDPNGSVPFFLTFFWYGVVTGWWLA
jgi:hypothetical protein